MVWMANCLIVAGWVLGDHQAEEPMNRLVARKTNSVVVSVNYRLSVTALFPINNGEGTLPLWKCSYRWNRAPEYQFPYAVNDCFDAMQWVSYSQRTTGTLFFFFFLGLSQ